MNKVITETRMLPYNFTELEQRSNANELARLCDRSTELEATHKEIKTQLKQEADGVAAQIAKAGHRQLHTQLVTGIQPIGNVGEDLDMQNLVGPNPCVLEHRNVHGVRGVIGAAASNGRFTAILGASTDDR